MFTSAARLTNQSTAASFSTNEKCYEITLNQWERGRFVLTDRQVGNALGVIYGKYKRLRRKDYKAENFYRDIFQKWFDLGEVVLQGAEGGGGVGGTF